MSINCENFSRIFGAGKKAFLKIKWELFSIDFRMSVKYCRLHAPLKLVFSLNSWKIIPVLVKCPAIVNFGRKIHIVCGASGNLAMK